IDGSLAVENRGREPGIAGADAAGLSRESFVLCGGTKNWGPPSDGSALRGAGAGLWAAGGHRGSTTAGQRPVITPEAKAWLVSLACDKAKEHGYPHELWTTRLLARHAREHGPASGHECLAKLVARPSGRFEFTFTPKHG